jgi:hypothetical protein
MKIILGIALAFAGPALTCWEAFQADAQERRRKEKGQQPQGR